MNCNVKIKIYHGAAFHFYIAYEASSKYKGELNSAKEPSSDFIKTILSSYRGTPVSERPKWIF